MIYIGDIWLDGWMDGWICRDVVAIANNNFKLKQEQKNTCENFLIRNIL